MKMTEEQIEALLAQYPGAKRAAQGVIVPTEGGGIFHIWEIHSQKTLGSVEPNEHRFLAFCSTDEIIRMRSIRSAHDYLLRLRAEAIAASPRAVRVMVARKNRSENSSRRWSLSEYYHGLDDFQKSYVHCLSRANTKSLRNLPSGLALINEANASCIRSFVGDVVVCSEALQYFYYFMNIGLYGAWHGISTADTVNALLIAVRIMNGSESLDFDLDPRGQLPVDAEREIQSHVLRQMQFTFGHEYAHYLCNHFVLAPPMDICESGAPAPGSYGIDQVEPRRFEFDLEFEADLFAVRAAVAGAKSQSKVANGAFSVLLYLYFLEGIRSLLGLRMHSVSRTHPLAIERIWRLWNSLSPSVRPGKEWLDECLRENHRAQLLLKSHVESGPQRDLMNFYGSVYLPTYKTKIQRDRLDF